MKQAKSLMAIILASSIFISGCATIQTPNVDAIEKARQAKEAAANKVSNANVGLLDQENGLIRNISFQISKDGTMEINYYLAPEEPSYAYDIEVSIWSTNGRSGFKPTTINGDHKKVQQEGKKKIQWNIFSDVDQFDAYLTSQGISFYGLNELKERDLIKVRLEPKFRRTFNQYFTLVTNDKAQSIQGIYFGPLFSSFQILNKKKDATKFFDFFNEDSLTSTQSFGYNFEWITRGGSKYSYEFKNIESSNPYLDFSYSKALFPFLTGVTAFVGFGLGVEPDFNNDVAGYYLMSIYMHPRKLNYLDVNGHRMGFNGYVEYKKSLSANYYDELTLGTSFSILFW